MDVVLAAVGAACAGFLMWYATGVQHGLYSRPEHRQPGDSGRTRSLRRAGIAVAAVIGTGIALRPDHYDVLPAALTVIAVLVLLLAASTDIERRLIPNRLNYGAALFALAVCWAWPDRTPLDIAIGAVAALGIGIALFVAGEAFAILLRVRVTPFGLGDVKLMLVMGLLLGWSGVLYALFIGILAAGVPGLVLTLAGQGRRVFPYGPFLILGTLIPLLWPGAFV